MPRAGDLEVGRSPTFQDPGTPLDGIVGTWVLMNVIEHMHVLSLIASPSGVAYKVDLYLGISRRLAGTRVPHSSSTRSQWNAFLLHVYLDSVIIS